MLSHLEAQLESRGFEHRFWIPPSQARSDLEDLGILSAPARSPEPSVVEELQAPSAMRRSLGFGPMLLVGNGRALWERFRRQMHAEPERLASQHPLDEFVEQSLTDCLAACGVSATVVYGHRRYAGGFAPLQRWAERAGALALSPSHLSVHPVVGPWLALRALMVFDEAASDRPGATTASDRPGATTASDRPGATTASDRPGATTASAGPGATTASDRPGATTASAGPGATTASDGLLPPCANCAAPCLLSFDAARRISAAAPTDKRVTDHWTHWLDVRDACPVGREYRYTDAQIRYHYARDRSVLLP
ncbi:MAG: hypothetical protein QM784_04975 [Polyangiaceae bacterium]